MRQRLLSYALLSSLVVLTPMTLLGQGGAGGGGAAGSGSTGAASTSTTSQGDNNAASGGTAATPGAAAAAPADQPTTGQSASSTDPNARSSSSTSDQSAGATTTTTDQNTNTSATTDQSSAGTNQSNVGSTGDQNLDRSQAGVNNNNTDQSSASAATRSNAGSSTPGASTVTTTTTIYNNQGNGPAGRNDLSLQLTGVFTRNSNGAFVNHFATNSAGLLVGWRYHFNAWNGLEANYGFSRNSQKYLTAGTASAPASVSSIGANMHELSANYVFTAPVWSVQPFILGGGGYLMFDPNNYARSNYGARFQGRGMFDYGVGVDFRIMHVGLRAQYRGLIFKLPNFGNANFTTNRWTHVAQPSVGLVFTF